MTIETQTAEATNTTEGQASTATQASAPAPAESQTQQAADGQTTQAQADGARDQGEQDATAVVPEKYELKLPEGFQMDELGMKAFSDFAKSQNMTNEAAQKYVEAMAPAMQSAATARLEQAKVSWLEQAKADKDLGGDKFSATLEAADKALADLGTPELAKLLKESGLNHHPEVIRLLAKTGKAISEDGSFVTGANGTPNVTTAQRMYPNMNP